MYLLSITTVKPSVLICNIFKPGILVINISLNIHNANCPAKVVFNVYKGSYNQLNSELDLPYHFCYRKGSLSFTSTLSFVICVDQTISSLKFLVLDARVRFIVYDTHLLVVAPSYYFYSFRKLGSVLSSSGVSLNSSNLYSAYLKNNPLYGFPVLQDLLILQLIGNSKFVKLFLFFSLPN